MTNESYKDCVTRKMQVFPPRVRYTEDVKQKERKLAFYLTKEQESFVEEVATKKEISYDEAFVQLFDQAFNLLMDHQKIHRSCHDLDQYLRDYLKAETASTSR